MLFTYKWFLKKLLNPVIHNSSMCTIIFFSIKFFYTYIKFIIENINSYNSSLLLTSLGLGVSYILYCLVLHFTYKDADVMTRAHHWSGLNLNITDNKFITKRNINSWVHHKNNIISVNLSTLTHLLTVFIHTNVYFYLITIDITYCTTIWYKYLMVCYFIYIVEITIFFMLEKYEGSMNSSPSYRSGQGFHANIYNYYYMGIIERVKRLLYHIYDELMEVIFPSFYAERWGSRNHDLIIRYIIIKDLLLNAVLWPFTIIVNINGELLTTSTTRGLTYLLSTTYSKSLYIRYIIIHLMWLLIISILVIIYLM